MSEKKVAPAEETFTVWDTEYVLTQGIVRIEGCTRYTEGYASVPGKFTRLLRMGVDGHLTEEAARTRARAVVARRIVSLNKQRERLIELQKELRGDG